MPFSLPLFEPGFHMDRFAAACQFFRDVGYVHRVFTCCNDATAVRSCITYRAQDNVLLGFGTLEDVRCPTTVKAIEDLAILHGIATQVDVYLLNPLDPLLPSFVLGIFPQNSRVDADLIAMRWAIIDDCLERLGLYVIAHSADGDPAHLKAMQSRQSLAVAQSQETAAPSEHRFYHRQRRDRVLSFPVPQLQGATTRRVAASARQVSFVCRDGSQQLLLLPDLHFQDPAHLASKLRAQLLSHSNGLRIGDGLAGAELFHKAFAGDYALPESQLGLRRDDLDPKRDPMDVPAFFRIASDHVLAYLAQLSLTIPRSVSPSLPTPPKAKKRACATAPSVQFTSRHLRAYLLMARRAVFAFLDPKLDPCQRLYNAWYALYFAEGWRLDCSCHKDISTHFLSSNQFACIQLNAESLLLLVLWYLSSDEFRLLPFAPHACASQQAEEFFRGLRAMFHDPNFTVSGCLWRTSYVQAEAMIQRRRADDFLFPQHHKHTHMDRVRHPAITLPSISESVISNTLTRARNDAVTDLLAVGVRLLPLDTAVSDAVLADSSLDALIDDVEECELVALDLASLFAIDEELDICELPPLPPVSPLSPQLLADARLQDCFSSRPSRVVQLPPSSSTVSDAQGLPVDKRQACALVSMHPSVSADRVKRVQKMAQKQATAELVQKSV